MDEPKLTYHEKQLLKRLAPGVRLAREVSFTDEATKGGGLSLALGTVRKAGRREISARPRGEGHSRSIRHWSVWRGYRAAIRGSACLSLTI